MLKLTSVIKKYSIIWDATFIFKIRKGYPRISYGIKGEDRESAKYSTHTFTPDEAKDVFSDIIHRLEKGENFRMVHQNIDGTENDTLKDIIKDVEDYANGKKPVSKSYDSLLNEYKSQMTFILDENGCSFEMVSPDLLAYKPTFHIKPDAVWFRKKIEGETYSIRQGSINSTIAKLKLFMKAMDDKFVDYSKELTYGV